MLQSRALRVRENLLKVKSKSPTKTKQELTQNRGVAGVRRWIIPLKITWIFANCRYRRPPQLKICPSSSQSLVFLTWAAATAEILLDKFNSRARRGLISKAHLFCSDKENFLSLQFRSADSISVPKATQLNTLHLSYSSNARHSPTLKKQNLHSSQVFPDFCADVTFWKHSFIQ